MEGPRPVLGLGRAQPGPGDLGAQSLTEECGAELPGWAGPVHHPVRIPSPIPIPSHHVPTSHPIPSPIPTPSSLRPLGMDAGHRARCLGHFIPFLSPRHSGTCPGARHSPVGAQHGCLHRRPPPVGLSLAGTQLEPAQQHEEQDTATASLWHRQHGNGSSSCHPSASQCLEPNVSISNQ